MNDRDNYPTGSAPSRITERSGCMLCGAITEGSTVVQHAPGCPWGARYEPHFYSKTRPKWHSSAPLAGGTAAGLAAGWAVAVGLTLAPIWFSVPLMISLCLLGLLACGYLAFRAAHAGIVRVLRWDNRKREGLVCSTGSLCDVCAEVKSWDESSSAGSTATGSPQ